MAKNQRERTQYPGVFACQDKQGNKTFYIRYRQQGGKLIEETAGKASSGMTAAKANRLRTAKIEGRELANAEKRREAEEKEKAEAERWTVNRLWAAYQEANPKESVGRKREVCLYDQRLRKRYGQKTVDDITTGDLDRYRNGLLKKLKPASVRLAMELLRRILNFGDRQGYCVVPRTLHFNFPRLDNEKTEVLTDDELSRYNKALEEYESHKFKDEKVYYVAYCHLLMHTGIRRAAAVALRWDDIDFDRGFICLRGESAKSGRTKMIPMSPYAQELLRQLPHGNGDFLFPQHHPDTYTGYFRRVCDLAGLPKDFRPLHGLRHNFASRVASSGQVDLYTLQNLLTHSSPAMTQRYAHLADKAMHRAAAVIDDVMAVPETE